MNAAAAHLPEIGRARAWRLIGTWILLFAFALQCYVTQTHFHREPIVAAAGKVSAGSALPVDDEAIACPLCQAVAAAGAFFTPAAIAVRLLVVQAEAADLPPIVAGLTVAPASFSWRSRAPPQS